MPYLALITSLISCMPSVPLLAPTDWEDFQDDNDNCQSDIAGVARLDGHAIDSIAKECKKSPESLANVFSSGLPGALLSATEVAESQRRLHLIFQLEFL